MLSVGDRVCYSDAFLREIGGPQTEVQRHGVVEGIEGQRISDLACVRWDDFPCSTSLVLIPNLRKEDA